jgi:hypothetical protein
LLQFKNADVDNSEAKAEDGGDEEARGSREAPDRL